MLRISQYRLRRTEVSKRHARRTAILFLLGSLAGITGCSFVNGRLPNSMMLGGNTVDQSMTIAERAEAASKATRVSNPPAQHIRFDGQERLLGGGTCEAMPANKLLAQVRELQEKKRFRSATLLIQLHRRSAQRLLLESTGKPNQPAMQLIAAALDAGAPSALWNNFLVEVREKADVAVQWQSAFNSLLSSDGHSDPADAKFKELTRLAGRVESPLLRIETLRWKGELQVATEQTAAAIESLATAAELAANAGSSSLASDLWLMSCEASLRVDEVTQARRCWKAAVSSQLTSLHARGPGQPLPTVDPVFWEQAVRLAHPGDQLPKELTLVMAPWYSRIGIQVDESLPPEVALWAAIADYQLTTGRPHVASLSIKRAETEASESIRPFLQIALARAMAAQGQLPVATTILGKEADSDDPNIRASALAVLGAIKIQSGAYEQGGKFLSQALSIEEASEWPGKLAAKADFANVRLILGHLDDALPALHEVQMEMLASKKWQSLCHSLENEAAILELDGRKQAAKAIRKRIDEIEMTAG